eukprot:TRINITY_DN22675_c0_g1_i1.p1 TRINITY_DN22675_c0_g1~~TRINITY_DN22675_c0_g1_i1.p1  ORF type:complete len:212 (-),score=37.51 TRINITY_DN22675_c0_g1_i1:8-643(-)
MTNKPMMKELASFIANYPITAVALLFNILFSIFYIAQSQDVLQLIDLVSRWEGSELPTNATLSEAVNSSLFATVCFFSAAVFGFLVSLGNLAVLRGGKKGVLCGWSALNFVTVVMMVLTVVTLTRTASTFKLIHTRCSMAEAEKMKLYGINSKEMQALNEICKVDHVNYIPAVVTSLLCALLQLTLALDTIFHAFRRPNPTLPYTPLPVLP